MAEWLLDTNHLSPLVTHTHPLRQRVLSAMREGEVFSVAVPCITEVVSGIGVIPRAEQNLMEWSRLQDRLRFYPIDARDAYQAGYLLIDYRKRGITLHVIDALIATIALRNDLVLLTTDKDFRAIPQLKLANWLS